MRGKIIINPVGGLANRMRCIASGVSLGRLLARDTEILWPVTADLGCRFSNLFDPDALPVPVRDIGSSADLWLYDIGRKRNLFLPPAVRSVRRQVLLSDAGCSDMFHNDRAGVKRFVASVGRKDVVIRSGLDFCDYEDADYRALFHPLKEIADEAERRVGRGRCVGLHIRRTDNAIAIRKSPSELFIRKVAETLDKDPDARFYLATDDETIKKEFRSRFGEERIMVSGHKARRDTPEGVREALVEMLALAGCRCIYGSFWSSFSEAAALLGDIPLRQLCV